MAIGNNKMKLAVVVDTLYSAEISRLAFDNSTMLMRTMKMKMTMTMSRLSSSLWPTSSAEFVLVRVVDKMRSS